MDAHELSFRKLFQKVLERFLGYNVIAMVKVEAGVVIPALDILDSTDGDVDGLILRLHKDVIVADHFFGPGAHGFLLFLTGFIGLLLGRQAPDLGVKHAHGDAIGHHGDKHDPHGADMRGKAGSVLRITREFHRGKGHEEGGYSC